MTGGYSGALVAAGAKVVSFASFGSYQGDWWALVEYRGEKGWVHGCYGSCSSCDAFQREFNYSAFEDELCGAHAAYVDRFDSGKDLLNAVAGCSDCQHKKAEYNWKLAEFGRRYLGDLFSQEEALAKASENLEWDLDAEKMVNFIRSREYFFRKEM